MELKAHWGVLSQLDISLVQLSFLALSRAPQGAYRLPLHYQAYQAHDPMVFEVRYKLLRNHPKWTIK